MGNKMVKVKPFVSSTNYLLLKLIVINKLYKLFENKLKRNRFLTVIFIKCPQNQKNIQNFVNF